MGHAHPHQIAGLEYEHVDVFTRTPLNGNGVIVFPDAGTLDGELMLALTREMRQFESIFLTHTGQPDQVGARIFTVDEELGFAGHPVLGAATVLHRHHGADEFRSTFDLVAKSVQVTTTRRQQWFEARMEQGTPVFGSEIGTSDSLSVLAALSLRPDDVVADLPLQVVSTGLPYLIVPLRHGIERVQIVGDGCDDLLASLGAAFAYPLEVPSLEGRSFDNTGTSEDIATGSAAGLAGAYLVRHGIVAARQPIVIHQGRFVGRPSEMTVHVDGSADHITNVAVQADVVPVARGRFDDSPI